MKLLTKLSLCVAAIQLSLPRTLPSQGMSSPDVRAAVHAAVISGHYAFPAGSCESELKTDVIYGAENSARLVVKQIQFDRALNEAMFLLRNANDPAAPPFYARCTYHTANQSAARIAIAAVPRSMEAEERSLGPVLVSIRRTARLYLVSRNGRAILTVRVLQPGHLGERVRVRLPLHGKMLAARVVGLDRLEASF